MSLASLLSSEIYMYHKSTNCHASPSIITYNQAKLLKKDLFLNKYTKRKGPRESIFGPKVLKIYTVKGAENCLHCQMTNLPKTTVTAVTTVTVETVETVETIVTMVIPVTTVTTLLHKVCNNHYIGACNTKSLPK